MEPVEPDPLDFVFELFDFRVELDFVCEPGRDSPLFDLTANFSEAVSFGLCFIPDVDRPLARDTPLSDSPAGFEVRNSLPFDIDLVVTPIF